MTKQLNDYHISGDEFEVMLQLLKKAVDEKTLTEEQLKAMSFDPSDILIDLEGEKIYSVSVIYGK